MATIAPDRKTIINIVNSATFRTILTTVINRQLVSDVNITQTIDDLVRELVNEITDNTITSEKITDNAIQERHINDDAITSNKIASQAITQRHLAAGSVGLPALAADVTNTFDLTHISGKVNNIENYLKIFTSTYKIYDQTGNEIVFNF
jgi:hypothetical protein